MSHSHFILHKPYGYLSQFIYELKRKKKLLGELHDFPAGTMAIGRLDEDSEGLLLLTTDGKMSEIVRSKKVDKEYYVQLDGIITQEAVDQMKKGVEIGFNGTKYITKPCESFIVNEIPDFGPRGKKNKGRTPRSNFLGIYHGQRREVSSSEKNDCSGWFSYFAISSCSNRKCTIE
jgi:23S rRNA pseudouridine2457 synthase